MRAALTWVLAVLVAGCAGESTFTDTSSPRQDGAVHDRGRPWEAAAQGEGFIYTGEPAVYAHTANELFKVDPTALTVELIGPFKWPGLSDQMTDIALDKKGKMVGISYDTVYSVDPKTAVCAKLAPLSGGADFNGLSFIASEIGDTTEILVAAGISGGVYEINPATGQSKALGNYGGPGSSGDLVSVKGLGTFATVTKSFAGTDWLARIDTLTGKATLIGDTGFSSIWGLGFWKNKFYGFTDSKEFVTVDVKTGKGTLVSKGGEAWWGAGVTTAAPVID